MKKTILYCAILLMSPALTVQGQSFQYSFAKTNETYSELTNATVLTDTVPWVDPTFIILPIGFDFEILDTTIATITFANELGGALTDLNNKVLIAPFRIDIIDRGQGGTSQSPISYELSGTSGNRILKVQWKNVGSYNEWYQDSTTNDYINFQMWLYEAAGMIQFRYGLSQILDIGRFFAGYSGPQIGIAIKLGALDLDSIHLLSGFPDPVLTNSDVHTVGAPTNGTIYTFTNISASVPPVVQAESVLFPNPASDLVHLPDALGPNYVATVYDTQGRKAAEFLNPKDRVIDVSSLETGIYFVHMANDRTRVVRKLIKN